MKHSTENEKSVFFTIISRINLFLFLCIVTNLIVYAVGNYKLFLDSVLIALLKMNTVFATVSLIFSVVSMGLAIFFGVKKRKSYFLYLIPFSLLAIFSFVLMYVFSTFDFVVNLPLYFFG